MMERRARPVAQGALLPFFILAGACQADPPPVADADDAPAWSEAEVRQEIGAFMDAYFDDLTGGDPDGVVARYEAGRATIGRYGALEALDSAALRTRYAWLETQPPGDLWWLEVDHDVLGRDAVLTTGIIGWVDTPEAADTTLITYTGLLVRTADGWRIRHEHESTS